MRFIFIFSLLFSFGLSAPIDTKLFDTKENIQYFEKIEQQIENSLKKEEKPLKIIEDERKYLKILKEANEKVVSIKEYKDTQIETSTEAIEAMKFLVDLDKKEDEDKELSFEVQENLSYLKKRIENILEIEKNRLLIYQLQFAYNKIEKANLDKKISLYEKHKLEVLNRIDSSLNDLRIEKESTLTTSINKNSSEIDSFEESINSLMLSAKVKYTSSAK